MPPSILENAAICLGRLAWRVPELLARHLPHFAGPWAAQLRNIRDGHEKEQAFLGLCRCGHRPALSTSFSIACDRASAQAAHWASLSLSLWCIGSYG